MRLGLVYLPPPALSARMVAYAASLVEGLSVRMLVGEGALPHLTLLHLETEATPHDLFAAAKNALPATCSFDVSALGLLRYDAPYNAEPAGPGTMAWLMVPCAPALRAAEQAAVALPAFRDIPITTGNGDAFQPHLTIAMWDDHRAPASFAPPADLIPLAGIVGTLALGVIGKNGTYERTLFSV